MHQRPAKRFLTSRAFNFKQHCITSQPRNQKKRRKKKLIARLRLKLNFHSMLRHIQHVTDDRFQAAIQLGCTLERNWKAFPDPSEEREVRIFMNLSCFNYGAWLRDSPRVVSLWQPDDADMPRWRWSSPSGNNKRLLHIFFIAARSFPGQGFLFVDQHWRREKTDGAKTNKHFFALKLISWWINTVANSIKSQLRKSLTREMQQMKENLFAYRFSVPRY